MKKLLEGKTALITGGARSIGKATAIAFAKEGANIAFTDLSYDDVAKATEAELNALGVKAKGYASNASDFADTERVVAEILKDFDNKIDVLVNNAGIFQNYTLLDGMTEEHWDRMISVNLKSVFNLTKAVQGTMLKQRSGSIINISSVLGMSGTDGQVDYCSAKAGILGFTKSFAKEVGSRNVRCNAIAPGLIFTEMTKDMPQEVRDAWVSTIPLKRGGTAEDVADVCLFLASDMSKYVTGQTICVCGGMRM